MPCCEFTNYRSSKKISCEFSAEWSGYALHRRINVCPKHRCWIDKNLRYSIDWKRENDYNAV
jgi:hypothetical protein